MSVARDSKTGRTRAAVESPHRDVKRQRQTSPLRLQNVPSTSKDVSEHDISERPTTIDVASKTTTTPAEIWTWTLTKAAVAPCFISDIFHLKDGHQKGDYFLLGRVPCRSVTIVGLVLGATVYEQRTLYLVDDGTGIIQCVLQHPERRAEASKKTTPKKKRKRASGSDNEDSTSIKDASSEIPVVFASNIEYAEPERGYTVRVTGRVRAWKDSKELHIDEMERCKSMSDELDHWQTAVRLHKEHYDISEPFIIPPAPVPPPLPIRPSPVKSRIGAGLSPTAVSSVPTSKKPQREGATPQTPVRSSVTVATPPSTASSSRSRRDPTSPIRLRHPSRLRSHDLTANTFRIYVKHYMDNTLPPQLPDEDDSDASDAESVCEVLGLGVKRRGEAELATPTQAKRRRIEDEHPDDIEETNTPKARVNNLIQARETSRTPTARRTSSKYAAPDPPLAILGFTLSYLRRVPELSELAFRVVKAEARRREKEALSKAGAKDRSTLLSSSRIPSALNPAPKSRENTSSISTSRKGKEKAKSSSSPKHGNEGWGRKMKRLFAFAIRKLYDEGSIVLWHGPVWPIHLPSVPASPTSSQKENDFGGLLWQSGSSSADTTTTSMISTTSSIFSTREGDGQRGIPEEDLSDPQEDEESYIPLTPSYLAMYVAPIVQTLASRSSSSSTNRHRNEQCKDGDRPRGPTVKEITRYLNRMDSRWAKVGDWAVQDALDWLKGEGRVRSVGDQSRAERRWELILT